MPPLPDVAAKNAEILRALVLRCRLLTLDQGVILSKNSPDQTLKTIDELEHNGLVQHLPMLLQPLQAVTGPLCSWQPGEPPVNVASIYKEGAGRWHKLTPVLEQVYTATPKASLVVLGKVQGSRSIRQMEAGHDYFASWVWLSLPPEERERWLKGDVAGRSKHGELEPDAWENLGGSWRANEIVGASYRKKKIQALVDFLMSKGIPFRFW